MARFDRHRLREPRRPTLASRAPNGLKTVPRWAHSRWLNLLGEACRRNASPSDALLITSSPRSGSTWLFELLASDPQVLPVMEPFHPRFNPGFRRLADPIGQIAAPTDPAMARSVARLVGEVYAGRALNRWSAQMTPRRRLWTARRTLVKDVHVNRALWWLAALQPVPIVLLVRHPCAVVESMLRAPWEWHQWSRQRVAVALSGTMRTVLADDLPPGGVPATLPAMFAATWAVETRAALAALRDREASAVVFYEDLVTDPVETVRMLGDRLGLDDTKFDASRPSRTTLTSSPLLSGTPPIGSWRGRLAPDEIAGIIDTTHRFGVPIYDGGNARTIGASAAFDSCL